MPATAPSRVIASTPLRMLSTRSRKNGSPMAGKSSGRTGSGLADAAGDLGVDGRREAGIGGSADKGKGTGPMRPGVEGQSLCPSITGHFWSKPLIYNDSSPSLKRADY